MAELMRIPTGQTQTKVSVTTGQIVLPKRTAGGSPGRHKFTITNGSSTKAIHFFLSDIDGAQGATAGVTVSTSNMKVGPAGSFNEDGSGNSVFSGTVEARSEDGTAVDVFVLEY